MKLFQFQIQFSNLPVMHVTMDVSNITQSNIQYTVIKIIKTIKLLFG